MVCFSALPEDIFSVGDALKEFSAVAYSQSGKTVSSDYSELQILHRETASLPLYDIVITHITDREYALQQKKSFD